MSKGNKTRRRLDEVDPGLEVAIGDLRGYCSRLARGRVLLVVSLNEHQVTDHGLTVDQLTYEDIEEIMREKPQRREARACR